jgi:HEAT repeat protein
MSGTGSSAPGAPELNGAEVLVLLMVEVDAAALRQKAPVESDSLRLHSRYAASIHEAVQQLEAELESEGLHHTVSLKAVEGPQAVESVFKTAKLLRERLLVDLELPARLALHACVRGENGQVAHTRQEAWRACRLLQEAAPRGSFVMSLESYLALPVEERGQLSPLVELPGTGAPAALFPADAPRWAPGVHEGTDTRFWNRFLGYLARPEVTRLPYVGFRLHKRLPPSLDILDVFVSPSLVLQRQPRYGRELRDLLSTGLLTDSSLGEDLLKLSEVEPAPAQQQELPLQEVLQRQRAVVVLGDPGSGKTTLLKWLAITTAGGPITLQRALGLAELRLPLLVSIGRLAELREKMDGSATVIDVMARYFRERHMAQDDEDALRDFLSRQLSEGRCLILLDGLDEVKSSSRQATSRWLERFIAQFPRNRLVASARVVGYVGLSVPGGMEVRLGPFSDEQVQRYVHAFERAYRQWETGAADDVTAAEAADRLLEAFSASRRLHEVSRNPFILSLLALIHRAEGQLPRHRVLAYEIFARTLCETWGRVRRITSGEQQGLDIRYEEEAVPILGRLALEMHYHHPAGVAPEAFVVDVLARTLQERDDTTPESARQSARQFLERAGREVQILLERGAGQWGFLHLTFQEFFAALGLHSAGTFTKELRHHLFDARWEEIIRLGVGYMALVQKRTEEVQKALKGVLRHKEKDEREFITGVLRQQLLAATLMATEAGDSLPSSMRRRLADQYCEWLCQMPLQVTAPASADIFLTDFTSRFAEPLLGFARDGSERQRARAIHYLGEINAPQAGEIVLHALADESPAVKSAAAAAAARLRLHEAVAYLEHMMIAEPEADVRRGASRALLSLDFDGLSRVVHGLLSGSEQFCREILIYHMPVLEEHPRGQVLVAEILRAWRDSEHKELRVLAAFGDSLFTRRRGASRAREGMSRSRPETTDEQLARILARTLSGAQEEAVKELAIFLIQQERGGLDQESLATDDESIISELLGSRVPVRRLAGATLLAAKASPEGRQALVELTRAESKDIRSLAVMSLERYFPDEGTTLVLMDAAQDAEAHVRQSAIRALQYRKAPAAVDCLRRALEDQDSSVRKAAIFVLGSLRHREALPQLIDFARSGDESERELALDALWSIAATFPSRHPHGEGHTVEGSAEKSRLVRGAGSPVPRTRRRRGR